MKQLTENQRLWLDELKSGKYEQGTWKLNRDNKFCCLGVAAELFKTDDTVVELEESIPHARQIAYDGWISSAPMYVVEALGLRGQLGDHISNSVDLSLTRLNDTGKTFAEIAEIFENNLEAYTK